MIVLALWAYIRLLLQGEVNPEEGTIDGMIRIAGSECAFQVSVQK